MSKTYFGWEGKYEIYNDSCIIQQKFNKEKELINKYKIFNNAESIPNLVDKVTIQKIIEYEFKINKTLNSAALKNPDKNYLLKHLQ